MEERINVAEILRNCPKGMELYSPLCGKCVFDRINMGTIICRKQNTQEITFTSEGYYMLPIFDGCECVIFPSKDQRDWSKFQRPFKDGDIITDSLGTCIFKGEGEGEFEGCVKFYCGINNGHFCVNDDKRNPNGHYGFIVNYRLATSEEKERLFQAIKANGFKWNSETKTLEDIVVQALKDIGRKWNEENKTLEKLIVPKFKVGDKIKKKDNTHLMTIKDVKDGYYIIKIIYCNISDKLSFNNQDDYELVSDKFDFSTLIPFESKVLVRNTNTDYWLPDVYVGRNKFDNFVVLYEKGHFYRQCIPYEGNEHLLATTNNCDKFYKVWLNI